MALFNYATKEITLKIVYYGPGLSGKTTNIQNLHSVLNSENKGKLLSLSTESDRTLFFDFLPVELGKIREFSIRFQLYTVPGQVRYNATRKVVLKGADGVVFVADSQRDMKDQNIESFENMKENLISNNINPDEIPIVLQYNKRDLRNILTIDELNADFNKNATYNIIETEAINGKGVKDTFQLITRLVLKDIGKKHKIEIQPVPSKEEVIQEEKIADLQTTDVQSVQLDAEVRIIEPASHTLEEELEVIEPQYDLEEELEVIEPQYDLDEELKEASAFEKTDSKMESMLKTGYETEKDLHKKTTREIMGEEAPFVSDDKIKAVVTDVAKLKTGYETEKDLHKKTTREIMGEEAPFVSDDKIKEVVTDVAKLKTGYETEKDLHKKTTREIMGEEAPFVSDDKINAVITDVSKLNAMILDMKSTVATLKDDMLEIKNSLNSIQANTASGEDRHIKELRKEMRDLHGFLGNIASVLRDLKIKKSWFRL